MGLSKAGVWVMVPSVRPCATPSAGRCSPREPAGTAARHDPLKGARPRPRPAPRGPRPLAGAPAPPRPADPGCAFPGIPGPPRGQAGVPQAVGRPKSPAPGRRVGATCGLRLRPPGQLCLPPGPSSNIQATAWAPAAGHARGGSGERWASQTSWGLHSAGRDTLITESHNINV